MIGQFIIT